MHHNQTKRANQVDTPYHNSWADQIRRHINMVQPLSYSIHWVTVGPIEGASASPAADTKI